MVKATTVLALVGIILYWASTESLEKYVKKNDMVLVEFWGTWCPTCTEDLHKTFATARAYPKAKFLLIAVSDNEYDLRQFFRSKRITVPDNVLITTWRGATPVKTIPRFWVYYKGKKILEAKSMDEVKKKLITAFGHKLPKELQ